MADRFLTWMLRRLARHEARCPACGKYFPRGAGVDNSTSQQACSLECAREHEANVAW